MLQLQGIQGTPLTRPPDGLANTATVYVVNGDPCLREALKSLIRRCGWQPRIFASAEEFLACSRALVPSCLILDVALPNLSGIELQRVLGGQPELPIIFVSGVADIPVTVEAMKAGAVEFLTRPFADETLLSAVRDAIDTSQRVLSRQAESRRLRTCYESLSNREREVMGLVTNGFSNKQVADKLGITEVTVKVHRGRAVSKMYAGSLAELVGMAMTLGIAWRSLQADC
jgi:RNA polymerase sigma factor (sigma-70 family)